MRWAIWACVLCATAADVSVQFNIVAHGALSEETIQNSIAAQSLVPAVEINLDLVALNATIIPGVCVAGYYWEANKCLQCKCLSYVGSSVKTVWFEPLLV